MRLCDRLPKGVKCVATYRQERSVYNLYLTGGWYWLVVASKPADTPEERYYTGEIQSQAQAVYFFPHMNQDPWIYWEA